LTGNDDRARFLSMKARTCYRSIAVCCLLWLATCGCAYFRTRELTPEELNQKNQEQQKSKEQRLFTPDGK